MKKKPKVIITFSDDKVSDSECKMALMKYISILTRWKKNELLEKHQPLSGEEKEDLEQLKILEYKINKIIE